MAQQEINYNGYTANPSDYNAQDGDLALSINMINEDGALKPILEGTTVLELDEGQRCAYIHKNSDYVHYIIQGESDTNLYYIDDTARTTQVKISESSFTTIYTITSIGNVLVVLTDSGVQYFLWKNNAYKYLGDHIPEASLSFGLQGKLDTYKSESYTIEYAILLTGYTSIPFPCELKSVFNDAVRDALSNHVMGEVNEAIAEYTKDSKFIYPFFVRYAYRMYDGSFVMASPPVLMIPGCHSYIPLFQINETTYNEGEPVLKYAIRVCACDLDCALIKDNKSELEEWLDIITDVVIFVSPPIYTIDINEGVDYLYNTSYTRDDFSILKLKNAQSTYNEGRVGDFYQMFTLADMLAAVTTTDGTYSSARIELPKKDSYQKDIINCSAFYKIASIPISNLSTERTIINIEKNTLSVLETQTALDNDDVSSHEKIFGVKALTYNNRLILASIKKQVFQGFRPEVMFPYTDGSAGITTNAYIPASSMGSSISVSVKVSINDTDQWICSGKDTFSSSSYLSGLFGLGMVYCYFFFPNTTAKEAKVIDKLSGSQTIYDVDMTPSDFLDGSFWFNDFKGIGDVGTATTISPTIQKNFYYTDSSNIYVSDVNNPFLFPVQYQIQLSGELINIASVTQALSTGQFGEFPLYAFTSEGIWALKVSDEGVFTAVQPISRDVCINSDSVLQLDSAVVFASDRGLMLIEGSQVTCISDNINYPMLFDYSTLPKAQEVLDVYNNKVEEIRQLELYETTLDPFIEFITDCRGAYDYVNQRIIFFNPNEKYSYVFSLKSKCWGMLIEDIKSTTNSYPECYVNVTRDNEDPKLIDLSTPSSSRATGLIVTRPFTFSSPDTLKTINTVIQRGLFHKGNVGQVLYGTRDLYNYHFIKSSSNKYMRFYSGTPYKAFRLVAICDFNKDESLNKVTIEYQEKETNKLR